MSYPPKFCRYLRHCQYATCDCEERAASEGEQINAGVNSVAGLAESQALAPSGSSDRGVAPTASAPSPAPAPSDAPMKETDELLHILRNPFGHAQEIIYHTRHEAADLIERLERQRDALQEKLDALMLEYCPHEMTPQQRRAWEAAQSPASAKG